MTDNPTTKRVIGFVKTGASVCTGGYSVYKYGETLQSAFSVGGLVIDASTVTGKIYKEAISPLIQNYDFDKLKWNEK